METIKRCKSKIRIRHIAVVLGWSILSMGCSKNPADRVQKGNFTYTVSGAASKTVSGNNAKFGSILGGPQFDQTFIRLVAGNEVLEIRITIDPAMAGSYLVNPKVIQENGQIIVQDIAKNDSWADMAIGSSLTNDKRDFSTNSANGGSVTITKVEANTIEGNFDLSLMELLGGDEVFNNPKIGVQGSFIAVKN